MTSQMHQENIVDEHSVSSMAKDVKDDEKNLTVKPIRLYLEKPKHTLKLTSTGINLADVRPLETQIAGHGSCNDGQRGLLMHESGLVLKPVQAPPKGTREVAFYKKISSSSLSVDVHLKQFTAKFLGIEELQLANGEGGDYLILENLTAGFLKPCVMDIKIGAVTCGPDASEAKKTKEAQSYVGTKLPLGFSVLGIISYSKSGFKRLTKTFGKSLNKDRIHEVLDNFLGVNMDFSKVLARCFLEKLEEFIAFFSNQTSYHIYASSLLFVYDYESLDTENYNLRNPVRLKLIDFAHVFPGNGEVDNNFLFGLNNLANLFRVFIHK